MTAGKGFSWVERLPRAWRLDPAEWAFRHGWRHVPDGVLRPPDADGVAALFREARAGPAPPRSLLVVGGGRQLARLVGAGRASRAQAPQRGPSTGGRRPLWVLDVSAVGGPMELDPDNLTLSAPASACWEEVRRALGGSGLEYPIEGPGGGSSTVGGHIASATAGPRRYRYGTARDWLLGMEMVAADGRLVRAGGAVVKNVAGYDLTRLAVGARGALGALVRVVLRLRPEPVRIARARLVAGELDALWPLVLELRRRPGGPVAMEAWSTWNADGHPGSASGGSWAPPAGSGVTAMIEYQGSEEELNEEKDRLERLAAGRAELSWLDEAEAEAAWRQWESWRRGEGIEVPAVARLGVPAGRLLGLWQKARAILRGGPACVALASVGSGLLRLAGEAPGPDRWERLRAAAEAEGGYAAWELPPDPDGYIPSRPEAEDLVEAVRRVFDPAGIVWTGDPGEWAVGAGEPAG